MSLTKLLDYNYTNFTCKVLAQKIAIKVLLKILYFLDHLDQTNT